MSTHHLIQLVQASPPLMTALQAAASLQLRSWCIGAGAIRSLVWDHLHGYTTPSQPDDIDLVYYESPTSANRSKHLEQQLRQAMPSLRWEVTNQATVHEWFRDHLGQQVEPLASLEQGIATWPEFATCVGVTLNTDNTISVIAPHGLVDLFDMRVRHNPARADADTYQHRIASKQFAQRWPKVTIIPANTEHSYKEKKMDITTVDLEPTRVACLRRTGPFGPEIGGFWQDTVTPWLAENGLQGRVTYGVAMDDPGTTAPEACRYDACVEVDKDFAPSEPAFSATIPGGRYACAHYYGLPDGIGEAWNEFYGQALPEAGLQTRPGACFERYGADYAADPVTGAFACDLLIPVE